MIPDHFLMPPNTTTNRQTNTGANDPTDGSTTGAIEVEVLVDETLDIDRLSRSTAGHAASLAGSESESLTVLTDLLTRGVHAACGFGHCRAGSINVRVTDDATIRQINRDFLDHDYATDVISFPYACDPPQVEGELVVSLDTAVDQAADQGWSPLCELLLYVVHGCLHLVGLDDQDDDSSARMRSAETTVMRQLNVSMPADE